MHKIIYSVLFMSNMQITIGLFSDKINWVQYIFIKWRNEDEEKEINF